MLKTEEADGHAAVLAPFGDDLRVGREAHRSAEGDQCWMWEASTAFKRST